MTLSRAEALAIAPIAERDAILQELRDKKLLTKLQYDWNFWGRPKQLPPPGSWTKWLIRSGRGFGKTRSAAEYIRSLQEAGKHGRFALVGRISSEPRDVMIEGPAGILTNSPPWNRPVYQPSIRKLTWPNGACAFTYTAEEPDQLRGPEHDAGWAEEVASWKPASSAEEAWSNLIFGMRAGNHPRLVITSTPRPVKIMRDLTAEAKAGTGETVITLGTTYENRANLAPSFFSELITKYEGTRIGRQELEGELLEDVPGALWTRGQLDTLRVSVAPDLTRVVVAIDPAGGGDDEIGIVCAGKAVDGQCYVLADASCRKSPTGWATEAIALYRRFKGDRILAEQNYGGDMVEATLRNVERGIPYRAVVASRGKRLRAEPIAALYEKGLVHHVGTFPALEDQMANWLPDSDDSPDRCDALVFALTDLAGGATPNMRIL